MPIHFGYRLEYAFEHRTPMLLLLHAHSAHVHALLRPDDVQIEPCVAAAIYHDGFGNTRTRLEAPAGTLVMCADGWIDEKALDPQSHPFAKEHPLSLLPDEALGYLRASRHCDVDAHRTAAQHRFGALGSGWGRVQAISHFARRYQEQGYTLPTTRVPAWGDVRSAALPNRDVLHFAIALCRALNIPARYCVGYIAEREATGQQPADFGAWFEAYLGGSWQAFDPWHPHTSAYRIAIGHGRDAADVPVCTTFGPSVLTSARVWADFMPMPVQRRAVPSASNFLDERYGAPPPVPA